MSKKRAQVVLYINKIRAGWWKQTMQELLPELEVLLWTDAWNAERVKFSIVWKPAAGWLKQFPNLCLIVSIGAGVDHVLCDPQLPEGIPILRTTSEELRMRMREYVVLHVLRFHRRLSELHKFQQNRTWKQIIEPPASKRTVGVMGLGYMGYYCADALRYLGFQVRGWTRSNKQLDGILCFAGSEKLPDFLEGCEILVCLLPLTPKTYGLLNNDLFSRLQKGACLLQVGRGEHLVEQDLLGALDSWKLREATLDVFRQEPLPPEHPFWNHPRIMVTPHVASLIDPLVGGLCIADNIKSFLAGKSLTSLVDPERGY